MLFLVIERFRNGDPLPVRKRFTEQGRLLPDGVVYRASWIDAANAVCFQIMEAPDRDTLQRWIERWSDLVAFEVIPVVESAAYWSQFDG